MTFTESLLQSLVPEVCLSPHQDEGSAGTEMVELRDPGLLHVLEGCGGDHTVAHDEDVCPGVGERPQLVEVSLSGSIE